MSLGAIFLDKYLFPNDIKKRYRCLTIMIFICLFLTYTLVRMSRRPVVVIKSIFSPKNLTNATGWDPFNTSNGKLYFSILDGCYMAAYSITTIFSGMMADKYSQRNVVCGFLFTIGLSGLFYIMAFLLNIHHLSYFIVVHIVLGAINCTIWPALVVILTNWINKQNAGLIFGLLSISCNFGNILGQSITAIWIDTDWVKSFWVITLIICTFTIVIRLFLVNKPADLNLSGFIDFKNLKITDKLTTNLNSETSFIVKKTAPWSKIVSIPGIFEFAFCLFFVKMIVFSLDFWLPIFIENYGIKTMNISPSTSSYIGISYDIGALLGVVISGILSDKSKCPSLICSLCLLFYATISLVYFYYGNLNLSSSIILLFLMGFAINSPFSLVSTVVSINLSESEHISSYSNAIGKISAIVDAFGSLGAFIGQFLLSWIINYAWNMVIIHLMVASLLAFSLLLRSTIKEIKFLNKTH